MQWSIRSNPHLKEISLGGFLERPKLGQVPADATTNKAKCICEGLRCGERGTGVVLTPASRADTIRHTPQANNKWPTQKVTAASYTTVTAS